MESQGRATLGHHRRRGRGDAERIQRGLPRGGGARHGDARRPDRTGHPDRTLAPGRGHRRRQRRPLDLLLSGQERLADAEDDASAQVAYTWPSWRWPACRAPSAAWKALMSAGSTMRPAARRMSCGATVPHPKAVPRNPHPHKDGDRYNSSPCPARHPGAGRCLRRPGQPPIVLRRAENLRAHQDTRGCHRTHDARARQQSL